MNLKRNFVNFMKLERYETTTNFSKNYLSQLQAKTQSSVSSNCKRKRRIKRKMGQMVQGILTSHVVKRVKTIWLGFASKDFNPFILKMFNLQIIYTEINAV